MEEVNSLILYGCKLARDLELNLQNFGNQPNKVLASCDEIIRVFTAARERFNPSYEQVMAELGGGEVPEWLRYGVTQAMGLLQTSSFLHGLPENRGEVSGELGGGGSRGEGSGPSGNYGSSGGGGGEVQAMDVAGSSRGASLQKPRRRKDDVGKRRVTVPAPRMGNTEIPPEDGHTWRKYGQKEILGSRYPRSYYRCTHQKLYQCPAKKQVQRLDKDPFTFEVTYREEHTCHMSSTAPSVPPVPNEMAPPLPFPPTHVPTTTTQSPPSTSPNPLSRWLSMNINPNAEGRSTMYGIGLGTTGAGTSSGGAGPSTVRLGTDGDYPFHVADLADAMFNTASGGNNIMDLIFSSNVEDKGEHQEDKKN